MSYRSLCARLQYLQCLGNGDTAVIHQALDMEPGSVFSKNPIQLVWKPSSLIDELFIICFDYMSNLNNIREHDDVIKWKHFPRYWPFVREIHRSPVNFPHKGQWRGALIFTLICARINGWVNNHEAGDLRRNRAHRDVTVMRNLKSVVS